MCLCHTDRKLLGTPNPYSTILPLNLITLLMGTSSVCRSLNTVGVQEKTGLANLQGKLQPRLSSLAVDDVLLLGSKGAFL